MDIIISHNYLDFDALAAMVLAKKMHQEAMVILPPQQDRTVKDFLSLYKDKFYFLEDRVGQINVIDKLILVDTQKIPNELENYAELIIYDHHPPFVLKEGVKGIIKKTGATTTILLQKAIATGFKFDQIERTLFALALYADTVSFTSSNTSIEDIKMLNYLWEQGFNLSILQQFVHLPLTRKQQEVLNELLPQENSFKVGGHEVHYFVLQEQGYVEGLSLVCKTLMDLKDAEAIFLILERKQQYIVIARSNTEALPVGLVTKELGGGGHLQAGSAKVDNLNLEELLTAIKTKLAAKKSSVLRAIDIMSSPVKTVELQSSIAEVEKILDFYGHNGVVVVEEGEIKGIFSRRDLSKVKKHRLEHAPVKGYMSRKVVSISLYTPLPEIQEIMIKHDIGRLPIVDEEKRLVGIVTRTDLLRIHHGIMQKMTHYGGQLVLPALKTRNIANKLQGIGSKWNKIIEAVSLAANRAKVRIYLVGGFVRDLLLGLPSKDFDLLVEGPLDDFVYYLQKQVGGKLTAHSDFGTATIKISDGFVIDCAQARSEYYEYPAAPPQVSPATLQQDLYRRDYTINALLCSLNQDSFGVLIDYFKGYEDLQAKKLQSLHSMSFIDDPVRILRGLDLILRHDFVWQKDTEESLLNSINEGVIKNIPVNIIKKYLRRFLNYNKWLKLINITESLGILTQILPESHLISYNESELIFFEKMLVEKSNQLNLVALFLLYLYRSYQGEDFLNFFYPWNFDRFTRRILHNERLMLSSLNIKLKQAKHILAVYDILKHTSTEGQLVLAAVNHGEIRGLIAKYLDLKIKAYPQVKGRDLKSIGFKPGPEFSKVLEQIKRAKLMGQISTYEGEIALAKKIYQDQKEAL